jgi:hypothetical protein
MSEFKQGPRIREVVKCDFTITNILFPNIHVSFELLYIFSLTCLKGCQIPNNFVLEYRSGNFTLLNITFLISTECPCCEN